MSLQRNPQLEAFARALPFEHLLRRRPADEALARWQTETNAFASLDRPRIALVLDCTQGTDYVADTLASWRLQTWPAVTLAFVGGDDVLARRVMDWFPDAVHLAATGSIPGDVDWVVPAVPGDLLHPSLAGVVAMHARDGARCVAWDWFSARRKGRGLALERRHRGPWRDAIAEITGARRKRAYAVASDAWQAHRSEGAFDARLALRFDTPGQVHPEPLSIVCDEPAVPVAKGVHANRMWPVDFVHDPRGARPALAATGVSVIILFRDRPELTLAAIESVARQEFQGGLQVVLVDNQSTDATREALRTGLARMPSRLEATWVRYDAPFNHSRQCNLGAAAAVHPVLLFLNNDATLLDSDAIDRLSRFALLPGVATVGARVVGADGSTRGGGFLARRQPGAEFNSPVEEAAGAAGEFNRITVGNTFACAAVSATAFRAIGGLDECRFPVGYNDVDFCLRAARAGWWHVNLADVRITHAVGGSRARTDEIAQKLYLRMQHPWTTVRALEEWADEPVQLPEIHLPTPETPSAPRRGTS